MADKELLQREVYGPISALKQRFFDCKDHDEWNQLKEELKTLLKKAEELMDGEFYQQKYKPGVVGAIEKIYKYKEKQFKKQKFQPVPKVMYLLQPELSQALTEYIKLKTKMMELEYEAKLNIVQEKEYI